MVRFGVFSAQRRSAACVCVYVCVCVCARVCVRACVCVSETRGLALRFWRIHVTDAREDWCLCAVQEVHGEQI